MTHRTIHELDPNGFNQLQICRFGPMLYNKNDIFVGGSLEKYGEFSFFEHDLFRQIVNPGDVVVEVGANIGAHTVQLAGMVGSGVVLAFEPQRIVFQTLCANLALNQCQNVFARQCAVGDEAGELMVPALAPTERHSFGSVELTSETSNGERVPAIRLDNLALPSCQFIKIDVEGMEPEVLWGAEATIRRCQPLLYVENDREARSRVLITLIEALGYTAYWHFPPLYNPDNFAGDPENIFPGIVSVNMLCAPKDRPIRGMRPVASPTEAWQDAVEAERSGR